MGSGSPNVIVPQLVGSVALTSMFARLPSWVLGPRVSRECVGHKSIISKFVLFRQSIFRLFSSRDLRLLATTSLRSVKNCLSSFARRPSFRSKVSQSVHSNKRSMHCYEFQIDNHRTAIRHGLTGRSSPAHSLTTTKLRHRSWAKPWLRPGAAISSNPEPVTAHRKGPNKAHDPLFGQFVHKVVRFSQGR